MKSSAKTVEQYIQELPSDRVEPFKKLREVILKNIPKGFAEEMSYGMVGYNVPLSTYPAGYGGNSKQPLPFVNLGSQKNSINLYHIGIYGNPDLLKWFVTEYPKYAKTKLDMGKGCIRFKKMSDIPYELIGQLMTKITVEKVIEAYNKNHPKDKKK
ncbi:MAG TPA: DUF1801 domain-containing protein [Candidatus Dojkabacteria bacterium]|nr:DUF1801 domain-containing protein [Candidatus Dojkabacteria bacterium]